MTFEIYQAPAEQAFRRVFGEGYDPTHDYKLVWSGDIDDVLHDGDRDFEPDVSKHARARIFNAFQRVDENHMPPPGYRGRSLSAGDLIRIGEEWWYCAPVSWELVEPPMAVAS